MMRRQEITQNAFNVTIMSVQGWVRFLRSNNILTRARSLIEKIRIPPIPKNNSKSTLKYAYLLSERAIVSPNYGIFKVYVHSTPQSV